MSLLPLWRFRQSVQRAWTVGRTTSTLLLRLLYRSATYQKRALPNLFVLGPPRSGTTSLDRYLSQHPSYVAPLMKELGYNPALQRPQGEFEGWLYPNIPRVLRAPVVAAVQGAFYRGGEEGYRKLFPLEAMMRETERRTGRAITADHTVLGIYNRETTAGFPYRMAPPGTKYITILRDPVEFLFSYYSGELSRSFRPIDRTVGFEQFLRDPEQLYEDPSAVETIRSGMEGWRPLFEQRKYFDPATFTFATALVCYVVFVKEWASHVPAGDLLVLDFADLRDRTQETVEGVFDFLGMARSKDIDLKPMNVGDYKGRSVTPEAADYLRSICRPYNEELYEFLGRDLRW